MATTKKKGSFRKNVIGTLIALTIVAVAITGAMSLGFVNLVGGMTTDQSSQALEAQIERNIQQTAEQNALVVRQKLASSEAMVRAMAEQCESLFRTDATYQPREVFYDYFFENPASGPHPDDLVYDGSYGIYVSWSYSSWYVAGSNSVNYATYESANQDKLDRASNLDMVFQSIHERTSDFRWLYLAFENDLFWNYPGSILGDSDAVRNDPLQRWYPTQDDWYQTIRSGNGNMVFVDPYYDPIENVLMISMGRAAYYQNASRIGVVAGDITVEEIKDKILNVTVLETGYAALITGTGGIVAHPDVNDATYALYEDSLPPLTDIEPSLTYIAPILSGDSGIMEFTKNNEDYLLAYAPVGIGGYISIIVVPLAEAKAAIPLLEQRMQAVNMQGVFFIVAVTIGGIVIAAAVAATVTGQITRPLQYLMGLATKNVTARITESPLGSADLRVDPSYMSKDDEIGELARAFQGMLDSIKDEDQK